MHEELLKTAQKSIEQLFADRSVGAETTIESLETLQSDIDTYIDALRSDLNLQGE